MSAIPRDCACFSSLHLSSVFSKCYLFISVSSVQFSLVLDGGKEKQFRLYGFFCSSLFPTSPDQFAALWCWQQARLCKTVPRLAVCRSSLIHNWYYYTNSIYICNGVWRKNTHTWPLWVMTFSSKQAEQSETWLKDLATSGNSDEIAGGLLGQRRGRPGVRRERFGIGNLGRVEEEKGLGDNML